MKYLLFSLLSLFSAVNAANTVKMPSAKILEKRLKMLGVAVCLDKLSLIKDLADKELYPEGVATLLKITEDKICHDPIFQNYKCRIFQSSISSIYEEVLKDYPEILSSTKEKFFKKK